MNCPPKVGHQLLGFFMTKYSEQFKLKMVEQYLSGTVGYKALSKPLGLDFKMVKRVGGSIPSTRMSGLDKEAQPLQCRVQALGVAAHVG
jgi:hypothetical protein